MNKAAPEVTVDWVEDNAFIGSDGSGHSIVFDSSEKGVSRGIGPMKALLASLGACSGMDIVAILGKRKQKLTSLTVSISGLRPEYGLPKPYTSISLKYVLSGKELQKKYVDEAVRGSIEKYCSVAATVNSRVKIDYSYEITDG